VLAAQGVLVRRLAFDRQVSSSLFFISSASGSVPLGGWYSSRTREGGRESLLLLVAGSLPRYVRWRVVPVHGCEGNLETLPAWLAMAASAEQHSPLCSASGLQSGAATWHQNLAESFTRTGELLTSGGE